MRASLLLRTRRPNRGDTRGSEPVSSRQRSSRLLVPNTPAERTTLRARRPARRFHNQSVLRS
jgi:hypothetical protein